MGVQLREIVPSREIDLSMLKGKKIAIDAFNTLYQFITTIRQRDGTPLMDSKGRITSHLSGLFYRTIKLVEAGIRPVYVFDGKPPSFKLVLEEREKRKEEAEEKLKEAIEKGDFVSASVYAKQAARLEPYMVEEAKKLLTYMGIPWIQAPSEGEAQAAYMAAKGDVDASASQDYDSLLFGSPVLIRNLAITGKRKLPRKDIYVEVKPEEIILKEVLDNLKITREQLIMLAMLVGTDFNPGGIKGIGPKKALELVKAFPKPELLFSKVKWNPEWPRPEEILGFFLDPPVNEDYVLKWKEPDVDAVISFMVDEHDFSYDRVKKALDSLKKAVTGGTQSTLSKWF